MEQNTKEHLNMDSAPGGMPPEQTPDKLQQKAPKGEYNPWQRNLIPHSERHEYVKENQLQRTGDPVMSQFAADYDAIQSLLPDNKQKQFIKDSHALAEQTETTNRMLKERDVNLMKQWIQQNPVPAAKLGLTEEDPYGLQAPKKGKKSPMKKTMSPIEYSLKAYDWFNEKSPLKAYQFMRPNEAMEFGRKMYTNPMNTIGIAAAEAIGQQIDAYEQRRAEQLQKDQAQFEREAKDFDDNFGAYIQNMENTQALDESSKELMAQQWKQEFAQLNKLKNQNPPGISATDYAMKKNQLMANAGQYNSAVSNIQAKAKEWAAALENDQVSAGTPRSQRDLLNTLARGKGVNFVNTEDGKSVMNKGLSIQNVNGQPSMVGFTEGMEADMRQEYNKDVALQKIDGGQTSFESWAAAKINDPANKPGGSNYENLPEHWKGVNIPVGNLANGDGLPNFIAKDDAFGDEMTTFGENLANQALGDVNNPYGMSLQDKWDVVDGRADEYTNQMLSKASEGQLRSIVSDYLKEPYEVFDTMLKNPDGLDGIKSYIKPKLKDALKEKFMDNPALKKQNQDYIDFHQQLALQNARKIGQGRAPKTPDEELLTRMASQIDQGNFAAVAGKAGVEVEPINHSMFSRAYWAGNEPEQYKVTIKGQDTQKLNKDQVQELLKNQLGIKAKHSGGAAPQAGAATDARARALEILKKRGMAGSPTQYREEEESPLMASRGARKAAQNKATKAAHAKARAERSAEWDRQREEENVTLGDIALSAAGAVPYAGMLAGAGKIGKVAAKVGKAVGGNKSAGVQGVAGGVGEQLAGGDVSNIAAGGIQGGAVGAATNYAKGKAKNLVKKGLKAGLGALTQGAGDVAGAAAKGIGIAGTAKAAYDTAQKANQYMRQNMTDEEYENFKRTGSTTGSRRGKNSRGRRS